MSADHPRPGVPFADGSISLRVYPHNELGAVDIVEQLCTQAAGAVAAGFDGVMTAEHHGGFAGYLPTPLQVSGFQLAAMAQGWAAASPVLLPLRPVAMLAEEVAWLDARHPGRVGVGVGPGSLPLDFEAMDVDQSTAVDVFARDLPRLVAMLRGDDLGPLAGDRALMVRAAMPIPVLSTAMSPGAVRRAAAAGAGILFDGGSDPSRVRRLTDAYIAAGGTGARALIRRVWLGEPPRAAFEAQFDIYRSYSSAEALSHWRGNGWICGDDPSTLATELVDTVRTTGATCLNLRIHAVGVEASAAREQITALGTEVVPRIRRALVQSIDAPSRS
jgi:alkanesulfonate monooxygenase SsuD/methylene tetrahydromethanopterin reductase-like flavin-dependent oxidoreductase (luciferase family)